MMIYLERSVLKSAMYFEMHKKRGIHGWVEKWIVGYVCDKASTVESR